MINIIPHASAQPLNPPDFAQVKYKMALLSFYTYRKGFHAFL